MNKPEKSPSNSDLLDIDMKDVRSFWQGVGKNMISESIRTIDDTSKQLFTANVILQGIYFHAITFSDLRGKVTDPLQLALYLLPVFLLMLSLLAAFFVFSPKKFQLNIYSSEAARLIYQRVVKRKIFYLRVAVFFLMTSILALLFVLIQYFRG